MAYANVPTGAGRVPGYCVASYTGSEGGDVTVSSVAVTMASAIVVITCCILRVCMINFFKPVLWSRFLPLSQFAPSGCLQWSYCNEISAFLRGNLFSYLEQAVCYQSREDQNMYHLLLTEVVVSRCQFFYVTLELVSCCGMDSFAIAISVVPLNSAPNFPRRRRHKGTMPFGDCVAPERFCGAGLDIMGCRSG